MASSIGRRVQNDPRSYGILDNEHQEGVIILYEEILSNYIDSTYSDLESQKVKAWIMLNAWYKIFVFPNLNAAIGT